MRTDTCRLQASTTHHTYRCAASMAPVSESICLLHCSRTGFGALVASAIIAATSSRVTVCSSRLFATCTCPTGDAQVPRSCHILHEGPHTPLTSSAWVNSSMCCCCLWQTDASTYTVVRTDSCRVQQQRSRRHNLNRTSTHSIQHAPECSPSARPHAQGHGHHQCSQPRPPHSCGTAHGLPCLQPLQPLLLLFQPASTRHHPQPRPTQQGRNRTPLEPLSRLRCRCHGGWQARPWGLRGGGAAWTDPGQAPNGVAGNGALETQEDAWSGVALSPLWQKNVKVSHPSASAWTLLQATNTSTRHARRARRCHTSRHS